MSPPGRYPAGMDILLFFDLREFCDGFFRTFREEFGIFIADVVRNEFHVSRFFVEEEHEPGASLQIVSAIVEMNGIALDLHFSGFLILSPVHVADDIAGLARQIGEIQGLEERGIIVAELDRGFLAGRRVCRRRGCCAGGGKLFSI